MRKVQGVELGEAFAHSATREPSDWNKRQALGCARNNRHRDRCAWGWHILKVLRARRRRCGWMQWVAEHHGWSSSRRVACGDEYPWKALVALCRSMQARGDGGQGEVVPAAWRGFGKHRGAGEVRVGFAEPLRPGRAGLPSAHRGAPGKASLSPGETDARRRRSFLRLDVALRCPPAAPGRGCRGPSPDPGAGRAEAREDRGVRGSERRGRSREHAAVGAGGAGWPLLPGPQVQAPGALVALDVFEGPACASDALPFPLSGREWVSAPPSRSR